MATRVIWARQLLSAILFLHRQRICHRDLKSLNILIAAPRPDESFPVPIPGVLKLCDFGSARFLSTTTSKGSSRSGLGTTRWAAPELNRDRKPDCYLVNLC